uniref:Guanylate cyclase domain-containing protein n=1 Tax=Eutreptiella gymnastica TaxID=73025 RepID=A0A7S4D063_9EUGL
MYNTGLDKLDWPHEKYEWLAPWTWGEMGPNQTTLAYLEIGKLRMLNVGSHKVMHFLWMKDSDWSRMLMSHVATHLNTNADAFLFSASGTLIASTCGASLREGKMIHAVNSSCKVVRETYQQLVDAEAIEQPGLFFGEHVIGGVGHLIGMQRIFTISGEKTPYFLALSFPLHAVDERVRFTTILLLGISMVLLAMVSLVASLLAWLLIAAPLRRLSLDMSRCVRLDLSTSAHTVRGLLISEIFSIFDSLQKMKCTLELVTKLVPMEVVQKSLQDKVNVHVSMTPTIASIFFLDIANFTTLTENTETALLVESITAFFDEISSIIVQNQGVVDKYIGDCVMAFWNTPHKILDHEFLACNAALQSAQSMEEPIPDSPYLRLRGRMGLETGPVYAGMFGSPHRMNYTVVGDVVNVASRLEGLNKEFGTTILVGPRMYDVVSNRLHARALSPVNVKGKAEKMQVYELQGVVASIVEDA